MRPRMIILGVIVLAALFLSAEGAGFFSPFFALPPSPIRLRRAARNILTAMGEKSIFPSAMFLSPMRSSLSNWDRPLLPGSAIEILSKGWEFPIMTNQRTRIMSLSAAEGC